MGAAFDEPRKRQTFNSLCENPARRSDWRSSPPAEKCGVCIGAIGRSQGGSAQKIEVFGASACARKRPNASAMHPRQCPEYDAGPECRKTFEWGTTAATPPG